MANLRWRMDIYVLFAIVLLLLLLYYIFLGIWFYRWLRLLSPISACIFIVCEYKCMLHIGDVGYVDGVCIGKRVSFIFFTRLAKCSFFHYTTLFAFFCSSKMNIQHKLNKHIECTRIRALTRAQTHRRRHDMEIIPCTLYIVHIRNRINSATTTKIECKIHITHPVIHIPGVPTRVIIRPENFSPMGIFEIQKAYQLSYLRTPPHFTFGCRRVKKLAFSRWREGVSTEKYWRPLLSWYTHRIV